MILSARRNSGPIAQAWLRRSLSLPRSGDVGALRADLRAEAHQLPRVPRALSHRRHLVPLVFKVFRVRRNDLPGVRQSFRRLAHSAAGSDRQPAVLRGEVDGGRQRRPVLFRLDSGPGRPQRRGEWFWGGVFAVPHAVAPSSMAASFRSRCRRRSPTPSGDPIDWVYRPIEGQSAATGDKVQRAIGRHAHLRLLRVFSAALSDVLQSSVAWIAATISALRSSRIETSRELCCLIDRAGGAAGVAAQLPDAGRPVLGGLRGLDGNCGPGRSGWTARR